MQPPNVRVIVWMVVGWSAIATAGDAVRLSHSGQTAVIDPSNIKIEIVFPGGERLNLSEPRKTASAVARLKVHGNTASWHLPELALNVQCRLRADELVVNFISEREQDLTWPVVKAAPEVEGYVVPHSCGWYIPPHDTVWREYLADQSFRVTELSMPFWGLHLKTRSLTFILTNPFNTDLLYRSEGDTLALQATHRFTRNRKRKEFGVVVRFGPPSPVEPARQFRRWLTSRREFVGIDAKLRQTPRAERLLGAAHAYLWGDGVSMQMLERLKSYGLDRMCLTLNDLDVAADQPELPTRAADLGFLMGPYDSYHSIHHPEEKDTWVTAQFDLELYETGPIMNMDGTKRQGFRGKGYVLSPIAARPYVEKRVNGIMATHAFNSCFVDCDAFGQWFDDYSEIRPASQLDDLRARIDRLAWINRTHGAVIGSEGGAYLVARNIHFAHGVTAPTLGWGDPDLKNRDSEYWLGGYWPPNAPRVFMMQVPLKPSYRYFRDPRFLLPLYQVVFNDSVVVTHHWGRASLKFRDQVQTTELWELLYNVPPLYHLNMKELEKHRARISAHYKFFSPLHRELTLLPLTDFVWLSPDRSVQKTVFGDQIDIVANFGSQRFQTQAVDVPPRSVVVTWRQTKERRKFTPR